MSTAVRRQRSERFSELSAGEIGELAARDAIVLVPVAATEQHGPHLPVGTDMFVGREVARLAAQKVVEHHPILVTEPVWTGLSEHHMAFGGTITLDYPAFEALLRGIVSSLVRHGFRHICLLNSHGGNMAALQLIAERLHLDLDIPLVAATYWHLAGDLLDPLLERQRTIHHACEAETSMMLVTRADLVDLGRLEDAVCADPRDRPDWRPEGSYRFRSFAERTPTGALGDPRAASARKGEKLLERAATRLAERLLAEDFWGVPLERG